MPAKYTGCLFRNVFPGGSITRPQEGPDVKQGRGDRWYEPKFWSWILCKRLALNPTAISKGHYEIQIRTGCLGEQKEKHLSIIFYYPLVKGTPTVCSLLALSDQTLKYWAGNQQSSGARSKIFFLRKFHGFPLLLFKTQFKQHPLGGLSLTTPFKTVPQYNAYTLSLCRAPISFIIPEIILCNLFITYIPF